MKHILLIIALVLVVAACNLSDKFKKTSSTNSSSPSSTSNGPKSIGDDPVEQPQPTAAQSAAVAGGESVKWDQQGISWTLPSKWKKQSVTTDNFMYGSGDGAFLIVSISSMDESFPTEISLRGFHEGAKVRKKNGQVSELKWLELDGVRGVEFREAKPEVADSPQRLQWMTYRKYAGQTQLVNVILSSNGTNFDKHQDELYGILFTMKLVH